MLDGTNRRQMKDAGRAVVAIVALAILFGFALGGAANRAITQYNMERTR